MNLKAVYRLLYGYLAGAIAVAALSFCQGSDPKNIIRLLLLSLPIAALYGIAIILILGRIGKALSFGMMELSGVCIGLMPYFSGLWPIYWMRWDMALLMVAVQCTVLSLLIILWTLLLKLRNRT
jgi:hypothetical protein